MLERVCIYVPVNILLIPVVIRLSLNSIARFLIDMMNVRREQNAKLYQIGISNRERGKSVSDNQFDYEEYTNTPSTYERALN